MAKLKDFVYELDASDPVYSTSKVSAQDKFACFSQGIITDRSIEHLGTTDAGVILMRKLFREGIKDVEEGRTPRGRLSDAPALGVLAFPNVF